MVSRRIRVGCLEVRGVIDVSLGNRPRRGPCVLTQRATRRGILALHVIIRILDFLLPAAQIWLELGLLGLVGLGAVSVQPLLVLMITSVLQRRIFRVIKRGRWADHG